MNLIEDDQEMEPFDEGIGARMEYCARMLLVMRRKMIGGLNYLNRVLPRVDDERFRGPAKELVLGLVQASDHRNYILMEELLDTVTLYQRATIYNPELAAIRF